VFLFSQNAGEKSGQKNVVKKYSLCRICATYVCPESPIFGAEGEKGGDFRLIFRFPPHLELIFRLLYTCLNLNGIGLNLTLKV